MSLQYPKLLSGSATGNCLLYDLETQSYSDYKLQNHEKEISDLILTEEFIITASFDGRIIISNSNTGEVLQNNAFHSAAVNSIDLFGNLLISCSDDKSIRVLDIYGGSSVELTGHEEKIIQVLWITESKFASCSADGSIRIWGNRENNWECELILLGHDNKVNCIGVDNKRGIVASASNDTTMRTWSYSTGEVIKIFKGHTGPVTCFELCDKILATGSSDGTVRLWNVDYGHQLYVFQEKNLGMIYSIKISVFYGIIIAGSYDSCIRIWEIDSKKLLKTIKAHKGCVSSILLHDIPSGVNPEFYTPLLVSGSHDKYLSFLLF